jgi:hypothetical protein
MPLSILLEKSIPAELESISIESCAYVSELPSQRQHEEQNTKYEGEVLEIKLEVELPGPSAGGKIAVFVGEG